MWYAAASHVTAKAVVNVLPTITWTQSGSNAGRRQSIVLNMCVSYAQMREGLVPVITVDVTGSSGAGNDEVNITSYDSNGRVITNNSDKRWTSSGSASFKEWTFTPRAGDFSSGNMHTFRVRVDWGGPDLNGMEHVVLTIGSSSAYTKGAIPAHRIDYDGG